MQQCWPNDQRYQPSTKMCIWKGIPENIFRENFDRELICYQKFWITFLSTLCGQCLHRRQHYITSDGHLSITKKKAIRQPKQKHHQDITWPSCRSCTPQSPHRWSSALCQRTWWIKWIDLKRKETFFIGFRLILEDWFQLMVFFLLWKHGLFPQNKSILLLLFYCVWKCLHFIDRLI